MNQHSFTLQLIHGREVPDAELKHWGFDAPPIHGVSFFRGSYLTTFTVGLVCKAAMQTAKQQTGWREFNDLILEVQVYDDLIVCKDGFYGDFELFLSPA